MKAAGLAMAALAVAGVLVPAVDAGAQSADTVLGGFDFEERSTRFELPGRLDEVSGLATTPDGRLFAHDDERAVIHEIDPAEERVTKSFALIGRSVRADFEGIAVVGERFFLVTSRGILYELREMPDEGRSPYRVTDTGLGSRCEIEGFDYDPESEALLFACKASVPERGVLVVHRIALDPDRGALDPILVDRRSLSGHGVDPDFAPSALLVDPEGTILLLSATAHALVEVDRAGVVLDGVTLSPDRHRQPEGLALGSDGTLYIADEADGRDARLTGYARLEPRR